MNRVKRVTVTKEDISITGLLTALSFFLPPLNAGKAIFTTYHGFPFKFMATSVFVPYAFWFTGLVLDYIFWFIVTYYVLRKVIKLKLPTK